MTAFRWIFETCDEESFKPILILNPKRSLENDDQKCTAFGLSLFENEVQAYQKYKRLRPQRPFTATMFGQAKARCIVSPKWRSIQATTKRRSSFMPPKTAPKSRCFLLTKRA